ncbi:DUF5665 domain-containing protein [Actibacterium pelagium]|uniref:Uncharacterized protein n=1 Tax=Actibacterium pelagium TaxID=2029103 RepID=A0A917EK20_9RHOB|nr:DUF5665 domain-containing protein [Actibacterium pelagium]GGE53489.1 hypothetical protein GCM10011517_21510 [Actibacterium pelagium]
MPDQPDENPDLTQDLRALQEEVQLLNQHRYLRIMNSTPRMLWFSFLRGLATGLGTVVGATFLVSVMLYFLSQIELIPIIGDWAKQIAAEIQGPITPGEE